MAHYLRVALIPIYLLLCLVLGGASGGGILVNMLLQLIAIPIILWSLLARRGTPLPSGARLLVFLLFLSVLLVMLQLVPLPPSVWTSLPGRQPFADGFRLLGQPLPWMPLSLAPHRTISSALWTLPAVAVFLGMIRLGGFKPSWIAWTLVTVTSIGVALGALQVSGGHDSPLYFYEISNRGLATGFFANSNNMAEMLVVTIPFLGALYLGALKGRQSLQKSSGLFVVLAGALSVLLVGVAVNGSLAGIGLAIPASAATALMIAFRRRALPLWALGVGALLLAASAAAVLSAPSQSSLLAEEATRGEDSRLSQLKSSISAAKDFMPVGSGIGTFPEIYPRYEDPAKVTRWYLNHVHNDYVELGMETGMPGIILMLLFLSWWGWRVYAVWRADVPDHFARAATIGSAVILAHSLVEFPLRTGAISALFAVCCALMAEARGRAQRRSREGKAQARHLSAD